MTDPWANDLLGYKSIGGTFTNLVQSIDTAHVISIEAGFGRGKTFFRTEWAQSLRQAGELVVEIDLQQSDHSGDPVITLLGALVQQVPAKDVARARQVMTAAKKIGSVGVKALIKAVLREGAEELIDATTDGAIDKLGDFDALDGVISDLGAGMSKATGQLIATQMAAEKVRKEELPVQLKNLHEALTADRETDRVIVILDELDRCHPDYAIAVLEAMKAVFHQDGFVFCLMVNAEYLETLAAHRFGAAKDDEKYLDKFVDIRLRLEAGDDAIENAVKDLAEKLPLKI
ncbi:MAG: KAP family P-loop NTPase fold protein, partial [Planktomarina sp.]